MSSYGTTHTESQKGLSKRYIVRACMALLDQSPMHWVPCVITNACVVFIAYTHIVVATPHYLISYFVDYISAVQSAQQAGNVIEVNGPCDDVLGYQGNTVAIPRPFRLLNNDLSGSYCIAFIVDTAAANQGALAYFHDGTTFSVIGSINITSNSIMYNIRSASASFSVGDTSGYHIYQLCSNGSHVTLYEDCTSNGPQPFVHAGFSGSDVFSLLRDFNVAEDIYMVIRTNSSSISKTCFLLTLPAEMFKWHAWLWCMVFQNARIYRQSGIVKLSPNFRL